MVVAVAAVVCAAIAGATYLVLGHLSGAPSVQDGSRSQTRGQASHTAAPRVTHHRDLRSYLIAAPARSHPWPHPLGTHRKLSLLQVAKLSTGTKRRRRALAEDHFTHGAVQSWIKGAAWVDVRLYQFASAADARDFFRRDIEASSRATPTADQSRVSKVPQARAFADPKPDSEGYVSVIVIGVKGDVVFLVDSAQQSKRAHLAMPDRLMREQYGKL
jgi:hypothetical protein